MSTIGPLPERRAPDGGSQPLQAPSSRAKAARVLACIHCQQRKIKCDRRFPCANCTKHGVQCVPATEARRRRKRFPERELLERLRKYEDLLRQNNVKFEPLHKDQATEEKESPEDQGESDDEQTRCEAKSASATPHSAFEAKSFWKAMTQEDPSPGGESPNATMLATNVKQAWEETATDDLSLFGFRETPVDLCTFHPEAVHIFKLWQIYLENVDPLVKVTHNPTLQTRIIEAAGNLQNISFAFEALMFGIYCMAVVSLEADDCPTTFGLSKDDLLIKFQFGCQQALMNAKFLRTSDRDCLTALYLYLLSQRIVGDPRSLFVTLGVAMRIAQGMGINSEAALAKEKPFEAEMRRRLWWSLMLFDSRRTEMADCKESSLSPTWHCHVPLNVNDSALRVEMKELPAEGTEPTEAIFCVVRSELADFVRNSPAHLEFTQPALKAVARKAPDGGLDALKERLESGLLSSCDPENPIHFMTLWMARSHFAKCRLLEHYANTQPTEAQLDTAMHLALTSLECDTNIMGSPLTSGYRWYMLSYFPFPAWIHALQDMRRRPFSKQTEKAWVVMNSSFEVRVPAPTSLLHPVITMFCKNITLAWDDFAAAREWEGPLPDFIMRIKESQALSPAWCAGNGEDDTCGVGNLGSEQGNGGFSWQSQSDFGDMSMGWQDPFAFAMNQVNWDPI